MGKKAITQEVYDAMLAAFREAPGNIQVVAKKANVYWTTAERAWTQGWENKNFPPIQGIVEEEQQEARARLEHEKAKRTFETREIKQELAKQDALDSRVQEARLVRGARENSIALTASTQRLLSGAFKLSSKLAEYLQSTEFPVRQGVQLICAIGRLVRDSNDSAKLALQLERLLVGAPTDILGVTDISLADAERETRRTLVAIEEAKQMGLLIPTASPEVAGDVTPTQVVADVGPGTSNIH